ncbi:MAG: gamma-glutamyl-gamma-aminobutyrate hydrolase family protein [Candidatus Methylomirabilis sp.]|nr:gamma-glutamyl-gamma-aminobutyrate hydrolase family protein [Deltaproteobacteria bacterium]
MKRALVITHVAHEGLGTFRRPLERNFIVERLDMHRGAVLPPRIDGFDALIVMGGPMGVYEEEKYPFMKKELRLIESALKKRVPVLGVCLGAQLLARASGARVYKGSAKEIGWHRVALEDEAIFDRLFMGFPDEFTVFQWHGDTFDVPHGAVRLASSGLFPNQVIKVGPNAYGVQFHFEVTDEMVREWLGINRDEVAEARVDAGAVLKETPSMIGEVNMLGNNLFSRFLRLAEKC